MYLPFHYAFLHHCQSWYITYLLCVIFNFLSFFSPSPLPPSFSSFLLLLSSATSNPPSATPSPPAFLSASLLLFLYLPFCSFFFSLPVLYPSLLHLPSLLFPSFHCIVWYRLFSFFCSRMGTLLLVYFDFENIFLWGSDVWGRVLEWVLNFFLCPLCFWGYENQNWSLQSLANVFKAKSC